MPPVSLKSPINGTMKTDCYGSVGGILQANIFSSQRWDLEKGTGVSKK